MDKTEASKLERALSSSIKDPELRDLNRKERRKYISVQRKTLQQLTKQYIATGKLPSA